MSEGHEANVYFLLKLRFQDTFLELGISHITPHSAFVQGHELFIYSGSIVFLIKSVVHCVTFDPNEGSDQIEVSAERICESKEDLYSAIDYFSKLDVRFVLNDGTDLELKRYNAGKESKATE